MIGELAHSYDREIVGPASVSEEVLKAILLRLTEKHGVDCRIEDWHQFKKTSVLRFRLEGDDAKIEQLRLDLKSELQPLGCDEGVA
jgi:hypothetical protein